MTKPTQEDREQLVALAMRFYTEAEAPSDEEWTRLFHALINHDEPELRMLIEEVTKC